MSVANDKGDNEMILGAMHIRGKPQKTSARRPSDEGAVRPVIASIGAPFLQMRSWKEEEIWVGMGLKSLFYFNSVTYMFVTQILKFRGLLLGTCLPLSDVSIAD